MVAKRISCPECGSTLKTAVTPGAKVRCPSCQHLFKAEEPEDDLPVAKPLPSTKVLTQKPARRSSADDQDGISAVRKKPSRADNDELRPARKSRSHDDDEDEPPSRRGREREQSSGNGLLLLVAVGGLLLLGGGAAAVYFVTRNPDTSSAQVDNTAHEGGNTPQPGGGTPPPRGGNNDGLPQEVLDRVKKATVYIRVTGADGRRTTGSGFFGFSQDIVLTNAHVVHMLEKKAPPPRVVEVIVNSGAKEERGYLADVVTVDHQSDLAVLKPRPTIGATWPQPLKVLPGASLRETQKLYVIGFPFGERIGKNVTVSSTEVSSLRSDEKGTLERIQVNGGMNPGNSGGPVVDTRGDVVGVAVASILGTSIHFAIPGEKVRAILKGRISESLLGDAYLRADKQLAVKLTLSTLDPLESIKRLEVDWWMGEPGETRPGTEEPPVPQAGDGPRTTTAVDYKAELATGIAELVVGKMPPPGKTLWCQPSVVDGDGRRRWLSASPHKLLPPLEDKPATLAQKMSPGRHPIQMRNVTRYRFRTSDGLDHNWVRNIQARFSEDVRQVDKEGNALVYLAVDGPFDLTLNVDGQSRELSPRSKQFVQNVGSLGMILVLDNEGNPTRRSIDLRRVPAQTRGESALLADQLHDVFDAVNVPVPGSELTLGKSWTAQKTYPIPGFQDEDIDGLFTMTYTYRGIRDLGTTKQAAFDLRGTMYGFKGQITKLSGSATGEILYDLSTHRVSQVTMNLTVALVLSFGGEEVSSEGKMEVEFSRAPATPLPASLPTLGDREKVAGLEEVRRLETGSATPAVLAFSPDSKYLATAGPGCRAMHLFDISQGKSVMRCDSPGWLVNSLGFSRNGKYVLAGGTDTRGTTITMWEIDGGRQVSQCRGHTGGVRSVWMDEGNAVILSAAQDGTIRAWEAQTGRLRGAIDAKAGPITDMAVAPNGSVALVPTGGNMVAVIDVNRGQTLRWIKDHPAVKVLALPNGFAVSGCNDGTLRLWDTRRAIQARVWNDHKGRIDHLSVTADGKKLLTGSKDGTMRLYDLGSQKLLHTFQTVEGFGVTAISPNGKYVATAAWPSGDVRLFELPKSSN